MKSWKVRNEDRTLSQTLTQARFPVRTILDLTYLVGSTHVSVSQTVAIAHLHTLPKIREMVAEGSARTFREKSNKRDKYQPPLWGEDSHHQQPSTEKLCTSAHVKGKKGQGTRKQERVGAFLQR